jgi:hypothetical protein
MINTWVKQPRIEDLLAILEENGVEYHEILNILSNIIKQQMLYGGSLEDKINYQIACNRRLFIV